MLRFAVSPRGDMNIETLRVALFNYMVSVQKKEDLVIRIEDANKEETIEGKDKDIIEILNLFSISYKYITHQSESLKYYNQFAMKLLMDKKAFNCFCSAQTLENDKQEAINANKPYGYNSFCENLSDEVIMSCEAPFNVRMKKPKDAVQFSDLLNGNLEYNPFDIDSFVILNHDKTPTYNFAYAADDILSNVSTVIRLDNHLSDTARQIHIRNELSYDKDIDYVHLPMMININELDDSFIVKSLIKEGYLPAAIANYLVLLGSTPPKDENGNAIEIFTIEEAITWFDISETSKEMIQYDIEKLKYINKTHILNLDELRLSKLIGYSDKDIGALAKLFMQKCNTLNEVKEKINTVFSSKDIPKDFKEDYLELISCVKDAEFINEFSEFKKYIINNTTLSETTLTLPLRYALTGFQDGPDLSKIYPLIKNYLGEIIK